MLQCVVWGALMLFYNLAKILYTYMLTSHPIAILLVYVVCYMLFGAYVYSIETLVTCLNITNRTPHISNKEYYKKVRWKHIRREYISIRYYKRKANNKNKYRTYRIEP